MTSQLARHACIGKYRSRRHPVDDEHVRELLADLDETGIVPIVEELVARSTGHPRHLSVRGLFAGMFLASELGDGSVVFTQVANLLGFCLSDAMRGELGIHRYPDNDRGFEAMYGVVRRLFKAILTEVDPSPLPKNKRLDLTDVAGLLAEADHDALADRRDLMLDLANKILGMSLLDALNSSETATGPPASMPPSSAPTPRACPRTAPPPPPTQRPDGTSATPNTRTPSPSMTRHPNHPRPQRAAKQRRRGRRSRNR
ncbi:hypothetical protein [Streptomyces sp. NPDC088350]|uniref:hypothetical protein n=1 Tax=Streptomyces sp. NPDC088350 TaxID=3365854 RepID=UPI0037F1B578